MERSKVEGKRKPSKAQRRKLKRIAEITNWSDFVKDMQSPPVGLKTNRGSESYRLELNGVDAAQSELEGGNIVVKEAGNAGTINCNLLNCSKKALEEARNIVELGRDMGLEIKGDKEELIRRIVKMELRDKSAYLKKIGWGAEEDRLVCL